jgi:hypothetical protein
MENSDEDYEILVWMLMMVLGFATSKAWAQQHSEHGTPRGTPPEKLGEVNFPVSCNAAAQKDFQSCPGPVPFVLV